MTFTYDTEETEEVLESILEEEVWLQMWHTTAAKQGCLGVEVATHWADVGLAAFQARFRRQGMKCDA